MTIRVAIYVILLYFPAGIYGQQELTREMQLLDSLVREQENPKALEWAAKFLENCQEDCPKGLIARKEYLLGAKALSLGMPDSALRIINHWLPQLDWKKKSERSPFYSLMSLKGHCLRGQGKLNEAYATLSELLEIEFSREHIDSLVLISLQLSLGNINIYQQKFLQAREKLLQAKSLAERYQGGKDVHISMCLNSLSYIARSMGDMENAATYLRESIELTENHSDGKHATLASPLFNLGILLHEQGKPAEAQPYVERAYEIWSQYEGHGHLNTALSEAILAQIAADLGQITSAKKLLTQAKWTVKKDGSTNHTMVAVIYQSIGEGYLKLGELTTARYYLDDAMRRLGAKPGAPIVYAAVTDHRALHFMLMSRLETFKQASPEGVRIYADSIEAILMQDLGMYKYLQNRKEENGDRQVTTELAFPLFEAYLDFLAAQENPSLERVFELMELGKARLLAEKIQQQEIPRFAGISDSVLAREAHFSQKLSQLNQQIEALPHPTKTVEKVRLEQEIRKIKEEQAVFLADLKREHPSYYNMKYVQAPISLQEAQADLGQDEALLSYFVGDSSIYLLMLKANEGKFLQIPLDFPLRQWVATMRTAMYSHADMASTIPGKALAHAEKYCHVACNLYDKLVRPVATDLPTKVRIIPDGVLSFIPFEALLERIPMNPESFRTHDYLILRFQFSYALSATLHHQFIQTKGENAAQPILVMVPSFEGVSQFNDLVHSQEEARNIQAVMQGDILKGADATADAFREKAHNYRILHIATHAKSDDQNGDSSFIAFTAMDPGSQAPGYLYARDIYGIPLRADMVVLSACETGLGEWQTGEGIIGLNRACMFAGAKSTMTSLWKVDDGRTAVLIGRFYEGLRAGKSKDAALREAKLAYLGTQAPPHPYYWASFIPIGNMAPIEMEPQSDWTWPAVGFVSLLLVVGAVWAKVWKG